jgi:hypothetical protein
MLRTDLIDIINHTDMWAFVGSGASINAGGPTWEGLVKSVIDFQERSHQQLILEDALYQAAFNKKKYDHCFSRIEHFIGRDAMEKVVNQRFNSLVSPGKILNYLADWPFAGYITTNYDTLIERSLREINQKGWVQVGNSEEEIRKISGDSREIVWHIHGAVDLPQDKFKLVLTEEDYDQFYLEESPMLRQLQALLAQRRILFIGFGFEDFEVTRLLKWVSRICNPARPAFAFLSGLAGSVKESRRLELLSKYNIDVIPYEVNGGSHEQLIQSIEVHNALILKRSIRFGQPERQCPSYDPETTGLMLYNQLILKDHQTPTDEVLETLLKARILALLKYKGALTVKALVLDLSEKSRLIQGAERSITFHQKHLETIYKCLNELSQSGFIDLPIKLEIESVVCLNNNGFKTTEDIASKVGLLSEQFSTCINDRVRAIFPASKEAINRVANAAECFLIECVQRRGLGVAMVWNSPKIEFQRYHMVALLQSLPKFYEQLKSIDEGRALIRLVEDVLARPNDQEKRYLGINLQAQFGVNLLGCDSDTLKARIQDFTSTLFLIDSSTLIPLLARSSVGHQSANIITAKLKEANAICCTTKLFAREVAEHARWAVEQLSAVSSPMTPEILALTMGRAGSRSNAFFEGFLEEVNLGKISFDFNIFLDSICNNPNGHKATDEIYATAITAIGIPCFAFEEWDGFNPEIFVERDEVQEKIAEQRKSQFLSTYKHERQVKAEAEALIIIRNLRKGTFQYQGKKLADAYFISHTRAIDEVSDQNRPITMRPQALLQWLNTITPCGVEELGALFNNLLWELSERGFAIVDRSRLQTIFSPLVVASRSKLQEEIELHRNLIAEIFGEDPNQAFREVNDLELPLIVHNYYIQKAIDLEKQLAAERHAKEELITQSKLTEKQQKEYQQLKAKEKGKKRKALAKKRAFASRAKGKGKNYR